MRLYSSPSISVHIDAGTNNYVNIADPQLLEGLCKFPVGMPEQRYGLIALVFKVSTNPQ
jgi:hypothetical protein